MARNLKRRVPAVRSASCGPDQNTATRQRIVCVALELFAENGFEAVTVFKITQRAGQRNRSAVHYYFGNKQGLVRAVMGHVNALLRPYVVGALSQIEQRRQRGTLALRDVVEALWMPLIELYHQGRDGSNAVRLIASVNSEGDTLWRDLLAEEIGDFLREIERHLIPLLPGRPLEQLRLQLLLATGTLLFGLIALGTLKHSPFDGGAPLYSGKRDASIADSMDLVCRGLFGA